jgi:hypothetical protein
VGLRLERDWSGKERRFGTGWKDGVGKEMEEGLEKEGEQDLDGSGRYWTQNSTMAQSGRTPDRHPLLCIPRSSACVFDQSISRVSRTTFVHTVSSNDATKLFARSTSRLDRLLP